MMKPTKALFALALAVASTGCAGPPTKTTTTLTTPVAKLRHTSTPVAPPTTSISISPHPSMDGLCAVASTTDPTTGEAHHGAPSVLGPGPTSVAVPPGWGPPYVTIYDWDPDPETVLAAGSGSSGLEAVTKEQKAFRFLRFVSPPEADQENLSFFIELEAGANQLDLATTRMDAMRSMYGAVVLGVDPGPLPLWLREASFTSWRHVQTGSGRGDILFTSVRPGSQVDQYRLDFNGGTVATLNQVQVTTVGTWQVVRTVVPADLVSLPTDSSPAINTYEIEFATDRGATLPNQVSFETEFVL